MSYYIKSSAVAIGTGMLILFFFSGMITAWRDVGAATLFSFIYILSGFLSFSYALKLKGTAFYSILFSSMFIRTVVMVCAVVLWVRFQSIHKGVFLVSLILWYVLLLIPEVMSFNRLQTKEKV